MISSLSQTSQAHEAVYELGDPMAQSGLMIETNKKVGFWGAHAELHPQLRLVSECLNFTGQNTGNLFIGSGLFSSTNAPEKGYCDIYNETPEEFDEKYDVLFIPASNFVFEYTDLEDQYNFFSKTKAQIFMFGLGSQVNDPSSLALKKGTSNFLRMVAERGASIGVRGEYTAEIMNGLGIKNVDVVGCPSLLRAPTAFKEFHRSVQGNKYSFNFSNNARHHAFFEEAISRVENDLFRSMLSLDSYYIVQNEVPEIELMYLLRYKPELNNEDLNFYRTVRSLFNYFDNNNILMNFLRWKTKIFFSCSEWISFMSTVDFSVGTRFHGNVAAILAGRPAHILCHDYRTLELCQFYKIPHTSLKDEKYDYRLPSIIERTDMTEFTRRYPQLLDIWSDFLAKNGLSSCRIADG
jgi:hypothetical protein